MVRHCRVACEVGRLGMMTKAMKGLRVVTVVSAMQLAACTTVPFTASIDAISSDAAAPSTYVLLPGNQDTKPTDLNFQEYASYVRRALDSRGYREGTTKQPAKIAIFLSYGVGDPQTHVYSYAVPEYVWISGTTVTTRSTVQVGGQTHTFQSTTTTPPQYVYGGYRTQTSSYVTYNRFMTLAAYDFAAKRKQNKDVQLWKTTATSMGESGDLRVAFPYLIAAATPFLGANTGQQIKTTVREDNPNLAIARGLVTTPAK